MTLKFDKKYFSIIFLLAIFMGSFHHHHHDLKQDIDCQICVIQSNIVDTDLPKDTIYLSKLEIFHEAIVSKPISFHSNAVQNQLNARAPPKIS